MGKLKKVIKIICNNVYLLAKDYLQKMDLIIKENKIVAGITIGFFVLIGVPLLLNILVIGNNIPSNASNDAWASFFGSYFGGIFGGILTLIGVAWTIIENRIIIANRERPIVILMKKGDVREFISEPAKNVYATLTKNGNVVRFEDMVLRNIGQQGVQHLEIIIEGESTKKIQNVPILSGEEYELPALVYHGKIKHTTRIMLVYNDFHNKKYSTVVNGNVDSQSGANDDIEFGYITEIKYQDISI